MILSFDDVRDLSTNDLTRIVEMNGGITITQGMPWSVGYIVGGKFDGEKVFNGGHEGHIKIKALVEAFRRLSLGHDVGIWVEAHDVWVVDSVDRAPSKGAAVLLAASRGERAYWGIVEQDAFQTYTNA